MNISEEEIARTHTTLFPVCVRLCIIVEEWSGVDMADWNSRTGQWRTTLCNARMCAALNTSCRISFTGWPKNLAPLLCMPELYQILTDFYRDAAMLARSWQS